MRNLKILFIALTLAVVGAFYAYPEANADPIDYNYIYHFDGDLCKLDDPINCWGPGL